MSHEHDFAPDPHVGYLTRFDLLRDTIHVYTYDKRDVIPAFHRVQDKDFERVAILQFLDAVPDEILLTYLKERNLAAPAETTRRRRSYK